MPDTTLSPLPPDHVRGKLSPTVIRAAGARRLTLDMRARLDQADGFLGLMPGTAPSRCACLRRFRRPSPISACRRTPSSWCRGWSSRRMPCDWEDGTRPIAWPSALRQQEFLCLSAAG